MTAPSRCRRFVFPAAVACAWITGVAASAQDDLRSADAISGPLEELVRAEMEQWGIRGVAVALVDGDETVFAAGFGEASRDSVFRVGSISKLFNALAVMQQVEAGALDLDAAIDPAMLPVDPFPDAPPVTLRRILCHRSGLQRESPVGGYFDDSEPGLEATVASLRGGVLATRPGEKTRYSNIAPSLAGRLVEQAADGAPFADVVGRRILEPLGMRDSAWHRAAVPEGRLVPAHMRVSDRQGGWERRPAPVFDLGTIPAGNLFSTVDDLARFAGALLAGGRGMVSEATLAEMWTPQLTDEEAGFGLGFVVGRFRDHRTVGHSGAVYGHSTSLVVLPEAGVAAIVLANEDIVGGRVRAISDGALSLLLEAKRGEAPPPEPEPVELSGDTLARFEGDYISESYWAALEVRDGRLAGEISGQPTRFTPVSAEAFRVESRIESGRSTAVFEFDGDGSDEDPASGFRIGGQHFRRVTGESQSIPESWRPLLGSYGPEFIPLVVTERHGHLWVLTENMVDYRLAPVAPNVFGLPPGMYRDEHLVFLRDAGGAVPRIQFASLPFERLD